MNENFTPPENRPKRSKLELEKKGWEDVANLAGELHQIPQTLYKEIARVTTEEFNLQHEDVWEMLMTEDYRNVVMVSPRMAAILRKSFPVQTPTAGPAAETQPASLGKGEAPPPSTKRSSSSAKPKSKVAAVILEEKRAEAARKKFGSQQNLGPKRESGEPLLLSKKEAGSNYEQEASIALRWQARKLYWQLIGKKNSNKDIAKHFKLYSQIRWSLVIAWLDEQKPVSVRVAREILAAFKNFTPESIKIRPVESQLGASSINYLSSKVFDKYRRKPPKPENES